MKKKQIEMSVRQRADGTQRASLTFHEPARIDISVLQGKLVFYAYLGTKPDTGQDPAVSFVAEEYNGDVDIKHTVEIDEVK